MKVLLDTCTFLWAVSSPDRLSVTARALIVEPDNTVYLSAVSAWEIAVKYGLGQIELADEPATFVAQQRVRHGLEALPLDERSALQVHRLPMVHRDPFDRMLICQAIMEGLTLLTPDPLIHRYPVSVVW